MRGAIAPNHAFFDPLLVPLYWSFLCALFDLDGETCRWRYTRIGTEDFLLTCGVAFVEVAAVAQRGGVVVLACAPGVTDPVSSRETALEPMYPENEASVGPPVVVAGLVSVACELSAGSG